MNSTEESAHSVEILPTGLDIAQLAMSAFFKIRAGNGFMKTNILIAALCAVSLLLFFGCSSTPAPPATPPAEQPVPPATGTVPVAWGNQTNYTPEEPPVANITQNASNITETPVEPEPEVEAGPSRNGTDDIEVGVFSIRKTPFEPLHIYVINDSHADAILVTKGSFVMLIDAGNFGPVRDMLDKLLITRINVVVATRDDPGAVNGLEDVIYMFDVDEFWDNKASTEKSAEYKAVLAAVNDKGIAVKHPQEGDNLTVNNLDIRILNPAKQRMNANPDIDAIVMRLGSGKFCAMLLNPTVQERENALIGRGLKTSCPVATFFKHGEGRPVPSILIEGNAELKDVIISVGQNDEGLPSPTTLTRLGLKNYNLWRTDRNGTIDIYADWVGNYQMSVYDMGAPVPKRPV